MIFDTHVHYEDSAFNEDRETLIEALPNEGVGCAVDVASNFSSIEPIRELMRDYPHIYGAFGIHPDYVTDLNENWMKTLHKFCRLEKTVAVGEIGLDYHWTKDNRELQMEWFERQLLMAKEENLPVIIHSRDAAQDTLEIAKKCDLASIGGIMHCYAYSVEMAKIYLDMGIYLGIGGVVTFKNAKNIKEVVAMAPLEQLVLETDCPYLAPEPYRGSRNSSLNLPHVVRTIAEIKGITEEEVERVTWENAHRVYRL